MYGRGDSMIEQEVENALICYLCVDLNGDSK